jgi:hypothetical protein
MSTLLITHSACLDHLTPEGHPERPDRLRAVEQALEDEAFSALVREQAPEADMELAADEDDGIELNSDSGEIAAGSGINVGDDDDMFADLASSSSKSGVGDDFMLTPVEGGELEEDDSGSQVIALDSESVSSDSSLFASDGGLETDAFAEDSDLVVTEEAVEDMPTRTATAGAASVPVEPPYTVINVLSLLATAGVIMLAGLMVTDLMWNIWSFNEPYALNSTIMDGILGLLGE